MVKYFGLTQNSPVYIRFRAQIQNVKSALLNTEIRLSGLNVQSFASKPIKMDLEKGISPMLFKKRFKYFVQVK